MALDRLLDLLLDGSISKEEYKVKKISLTENKRKSKDALNSLDKQQDKLLELSEKTFEFAAYSRYWFKSGDKQTKRQILSSLGQNILLKDKIISIEATKPFSIIQKGLELVPEAIGTLEPINSGSGKGASFDTPNPTWLRR